MQDIYSGLGCVEGIDKLFKDPTSKNILLVTGKNSFELSGAKKKLNPFLKKHKIYHFFDFEVNPKISDAKKGARIAKKNKIDIIIAVGGGSVLDTAKLVKAFLIDPEKAEIFAKGQMHLVDPGVPIVAIPTTAGSGSESTHFAVVYIDREKYSVANSFLLPNIVILDGTLAISSSKYQKANNILDATAQAVESAWSLNSTNESIKLSYKALMGISEAYKKYFKLSDLKSSQIMLNSANIAGQAINITKTTAPHAWSYGISLEANIPHGHAIWTTFPKIYNLHFNNQDLLVTDPRGAKHLSEIMKNINNLIGLDDDTNIINFFEDFLLSLDIKASLKNDLNANDQQRERLSKKVNKERLLNNPIEYSQENINYIFDLKN
jgi:alcohol dehydrogenase